MTRTALFICLLASAWQSALAQQTAHFETTLYFEDAVGNRDSVVIGYDTLATNDIDPEFGEQELLSPFDSIFEIRAGTSYFLLRDKLSKKIINRGSPATGPFPLGNCYSGLNIFIYVWAKHQPVKVWWDRTVFLEPPCYRASVLFNHWLDDLAGPISPDDIPPEYACLAAENYTYFDLSEEHLMNGEIFLDQRIIIEKQVEGLGLQTIYGLRFKPASPYDYSPCYWVTSSREVQAPAPVFLFPNPTVGSARFRLPEGTEAVRWQLFGLAGTLLREQRGTGAGEVDLMGLPAGIYQLLLQGSDGKRYWGRVVKQ